MSGSLDTAPISTSAASSVQSDHPETREIQLVWTDFDSATKETTFQPSVTVKTTEKPYENGFKPVGRACDVFNTTASTDYHLYGDDGKGNRVPEIPLGPGRNMSR